MRPLATSGAAYTTLTSTGASLPGAIKRRPSVDIYRDTTTNGQIAVAAHPVTLVPEPATAALLLLTGAAVALRRR